MQILIVEDDPQVAAYITNRLINWKHNPDSAGTGREALKLFSVKKFDLIILDIMLPDYIAYNLIPKFREINPNIAIITMTGQNSRELEQKIRQQGILYYMVKPIELKNLKLLLDHMENNIKDIITTHL